MSVASVVPKVRIMNAGEGKTITIDKGTAISLGIAIPVLAAIITLITMIVTMQARLEVLSQETEHMRTEIREVKKDYVSSDILDIKLQSIEARLVDIQEALKK